PSGTPGWRSRCGWRRAVSGTDVGNPASPAAPRDGGVRRIDTDSAGAGKGPQNRWRPRMNTVPLRPGAATPCPLPVGERVAGDARAYHLRDHRDDNRRLFLVVGPQLQ